MFVNSMAIRSFDHIIKRFKGSVTSNHYFLEPKSNNLGLGLVNPHYKSLHSFHYSDDTKLDYVLNMFNGLIHTFSHGQSVSKFNKLLDTVTDMKHYPCSIQLFKQMCAVGVLVDDCTIDIVIKCYSGMNQTEQGLTVLGYCFKRGVVLDVTTYNALLNGFIVEHRTHDAETLFKKLINNNNNYLCEPNVATYNTMIKGLSKIGNHYVAIGLVRLMVHGRSGDCKPNYDTYNTIIDGMCQDVTMIDDAFKLFIEMSRQHIFAGIYTYNSLIYALCTLGRWDDVSRKLKFFWDKGMYPNSKTFEILADARYKVGKGDSRSILNIMSRYGFDTETNLQERYGSHVIKNKLAAGNSKYEMIDEAMNMYTIRVETTNCDFFINDTQPQSNYYTRRVILQSKDPCDKQSSELFYLSKHKSLDWHSHDNKYYEVVDFLSFFPHIDMHGIVIEFASSIGKFDVSRRLFQDLLISKGLPRPTVKTYGVMIRGFCRRGLLKDAKHLFVKMKNRGCEPDVVIINDLIQGYLENKPIHDAVLFLKELNGSGDSVSETISNQNILKFIDGLRNIPDYLFEFIRDECMPEAYKCCFKERDITDDLLPKKEVKDRDTLFNDELQELLEKGFLHEVIWHLEFETESGYSVSDKISKPNVMKLIDRFYRKGINVPEDVFYYLQEKCVPEEYKCGPEGCYVDSSMIERLPEEEGRDSDDNVCNLWLPEEEEERVSRCKPAVVSDNDPTKKFNWHVSELIQLAEKWER